MPLVRRELPALYNGISQQPTPLRLTSQAEVNINCLSSVVDGVAKRPPIQELAIVSTSAYGAAYVHTINRSILEQYTVVITNGNIVIFAMDGTPRTVNFPHGTGYLAAASPQTTFNAVTVADYTFIVNKSVTVAMTAGGTDQAAVPANYAGIRYNQDLAVNGSYVQYPPNPPGTTLKGTVQTFAALPGQPGVAGAGPTNGDIYLVQGSSTDTGFGGFYVLWSGGVWNETVKPGIQNLIDATTMPWALIRNADGTFTFTPFSWKPRVVGDDTLNPVPSFVGRPLRDIFFARNRLGITADQNCIFSAVGDFGNFFRLTVMDLLASDVVDLAVSSTSVAYLNFGVPFYNNFMLFSDQAQFQLNVTGEMTPTTCSLDAVTSYQMSTVARPVGIGSDVYFVSEKSNFATVWDYFIRSDVIVNSAEELTAHVPRFIPAGVIKLTASAERDMLFLLTTGAQSSLYVYKFFWLSGQKVQSAWSNWVFDPSDTILNCECLNSKLYMVIQRGTQVRLGFIDLMPQVTVSDLTFDVLLDNRVSILGVWSSVPNTTAFTLPYACNPATFNMVRSGPTSWGTLAGALVDPTTYTFSNGNKTVTVPGNTTAGHVYAGENYNQVYTFSQFFQQDMRTNVAITTGRLQLKTLFVYYVGTAYFTTVVDSYGVGGAGSQQSESISVGNFSTFDAKTVGEASLILGTPVFASGVYAFTIMGDSRTTSITLQNNSPYMSRFQGAEWEALYYNRAA